MIALRQAVRMNLAAAQVTLHTGLAPIDDVGPSSSDREDMSDLAGRKRLERIGLVHNDGERTEPGLRIERAVRDANAERITVDQRPICGSEIARKLHANRGKGRFIKDERVLRRQRVAGDV